MNLLTDDNDNKYFGTLEDVKSELYPIKVWNILQFYCLSGRKTVISKDNVIPIADLKYCVFSPHENKYYVRDFHNWTLNQSYFYRKDLDFSGEDEAIEALKRYITDGNVHLLMNNGQVQEMSALLKRLWKSQFLGDGKLPYKSWIALLQTSLDYEDYKDYGKDLMGYKTICHRYEIHIRAIWDEAYLQTEKIKPNDNTKKDC